MATTTMTAPSACGYVSMALLALQFGLQPILYKEFASRAKHSSVLVIACECCKLAAAALALVLGGEARGVWKSWRLRESLAACGLPACTYAVQNVLVQIAYQNLPPIVFNLVNQTKLLWTALFVYAMLGKRFSKPQCLAMLLLLSAAVLLSLAKDPAASSASPSSQRTTSFEFGLVPVLLASILSGFGAATTQRAMQHHARHPALVAMELAVYGTVFLVGSQLYAPASAPSLLTSLTSSDRFFALFEGWDATTWIPIAANALGGLLVGAVTKYVGGVLKSFALVCGIAFTAFVESALYGHALAPEVWLAAALVTVSMFVYNAFPYQQEDAAKPKGM